MNIIEMYDFEPSMDKDRYSAIGMGGDFLFVVFTERGENIRQISARWATEKDSIMTRIFTIKDGHGYKRTVG